MTLLELIGGIAGIGIVHFLGKKCIEAKEHEELEAKVKRDEEMREEMSSIMNEDSKRVTEMMNKMFKEKAIDDFFGIGNK